MEMRLKDIEFLKLLPAFMREDTAIIGMSKGVDEVIKMFAGFADNMSTWAAIDNLTEAELDELAWELNIQWYEPDAAIEIKREIVKNSDLVQQRLGTKWAVENVITTYFGSGNIKEWFEYDGEPGHFRIESNNPSVTNEQLNKFIRILNKVKRKSAFLDGVFITLGAQADINMGVGFHETKISTVRFGKATG